MEFIFGAIISFFITAFFMQSKKDQVIEAEKRSLQALRDQTYQSQNSLNESMKRFEAEKTQTFNAIEVAKKELQQKEIDVQNKNEIFARSFLEGRKWLIDMMAEAETKKDLQYVSYLNNKKNPAPSTAKQVEALIKNKNKQLIKECKALEYQIKTYHEYFPLLEEYEEAILDEVINFNEELADQDRTLKYLTTEEYKDLPIDERNQLALDRYTERSKNNAEIGLFYERYIGYLYEQKGWEVIYQGALAGRLDRGVDLICKKGNIVKLVQCKCWAKNKKIYEKYIFQLFGVLQSSIYTNEFGPNKIIEAELVITNSLDSFAEYMAKILGISVKQQRLEKDYPKIKCTTSSEGEKIFHLPMDQQYDKIIMNGKKDRFYAHTIKEAVSKGHRRAFRYQFGN